MIEMYKLINNISPPIMNSFFCDNVYSICIFLDYIEQHKDTSKICFQIHFIWVVFFMGKYTVFKSLQSKDKERKVKNLGKEFFPSKDLRSFNSNNYNIVVNCVKASSARDRVTNKSSFLSILP